jgi:hypothetical protein
MTLPGKVCRKDSLVAYTFTDYYRTVRWVLRINGVVIGFGLGLLLLIYPEPILARAGVEILGADWTARIGGSSLVGMGLGLLLAAGEPEVRLATLLMAILSNGGIVITLLWAYLQGELQGLTPLGVAGLLLIFAVGLMTAVLPIAYLRSARF